MVAKVFIYSGMGAQWKTMGQSLFKNIQLFRQKVEELDLPIKQQTGFSVIEEILRDKETSRLNNPWIAHPVTFAIQVGITAIFKSFGITPAAVAGHSGGEVAACYIAGALSLDDAVRLLGAHCQVMKQVQGAGKMLFVALPYQEVAKYISEHNLNLSIATVNDPKSTVVSGSEDIDLLVTFFEKQSVYCKLLNTDVAFHSVFVEPALPVLRNALKGITPLSQKIPIYSCLKGKLATQDDFTDSYWVSHIREPVIFASAIKAALDDGYTNFLEISPHPILQNSLIECFSQADTVAQAIGTMERDSGTIDDLIRGVVLLEKSGDKICLDSCSKEELAKIDSFRLRASFSNIKIMNRLDMLQLVNHALETESSGSITAPDEHTGFFDLGVDSFMMVQIARNIEISIGVALPNTTLFDHTSPGMLADYLLELLYGKNNTQTVLKQKRAVCDENEPIAIIGMGCRLPGGANSPDEFWDIIANKKMVTSEVPLTRWNPEEYYDANPEVLGKSYVKRGGFLSPDRLEQFDAPFFHIPPREARALDPQQRLLLEVAWETMEQANIPLDILKEQYVGVYLGICCDDYKLAHIYSSGLDKIDAYSASGSVSSSAGGRLSYIFDFTGPNLSVDTACSSSLIATHLACQGLRRGECDAAMAAGVNLLLVPNHFVYFSKLGALSPDGSSKSFDASANGYARGEGCGVLLLKRLSDAQRDGDNILALIKGSAIGQDGASSSFTAPSGLAQQRVINRALEDAGLNALDISYVEAHGTGTALGDVVEVSGIIAAYCKERNPEKPLMLGSVKANIGHLEGAAGMASLIKTVQALRHECFPPQPLLNSLNPQIPWDNVALKVVTESSPWIGISNDESKTPRRAGVSGFGFSGSNAHIILEEAPVVSPKPAFTPPSCQILELSAATLPALREMAENYTKYLLTADAELVDICITAANGRNRFPERLAVSGKTLNELIDVLKSRTAKGLTSQASTKNKGVAFLFTGQGSQYPGMGKELYETWPAYRDALDLCDKLFATHLGCSIKDIMHGDDAELLSRTLYTQPAIFALQYSLCALWKSFGVVPATGAGHSIGEFAAACQAGILTLEDAVNLVSNRASLMDSIPTGGLMASLPATEEEIAPLVAPLSDKVAIAALNTKQSVVISGQNEAVQQIVAEMEKSGKQARYLQVSHPFHSPVMDPILEKFEQVAASITTSPANIPLVSGLTGTTAVAEDFHTKAYWRNQLRQPVRFGAALETLLNQGYTTFVEIGSAPILSGFGKTISSESGNAWLLSLRSGQNDTLQMVSSLCTLIERSITSASSFYGKDVKGSVQLPTYPFQRASYWTELYKTPVNAGSNLTRSGDPLLGERVESPALGDGTLFSTTFTPTAPRFLADHVIFDRVLSPAAAHICMMTAAARRASADTSAPVILKGVHFVRPLLVGEEGRTVQVILGSPVNGERSARIVSRSLDENSLTWQEHCQGIATTIKLEKRVINLESIKQRCTEVVDAKAFYKAFIAAGYNVGPSYQRIREIYAGIDESICCLEGVSQPGDPDPGLMDAILQSGIGAASKEFLKAIEGGERIYIPIGTQEIQFAAPLTSEVWCHSRSRITGDAVEADVDVYSAEGVLLMSLKGFTGRRTDRKTIFANENSAEIYYQMIWKPLNISIENLENQKYLIIGDTPKAELLTKNIIKSGCYAINKSSSEIGITDVIQKLEDNDKLTILFVAPLAETETGITKLPEELSDFAKLVSALGENFALAEKIKLWLITEGSIALEEVEVNPLQSAFFGFGRAASLEYQQIWGGIVDLDNQLSMEALQKLLSFMKTPGDLKELAVRGENLFTSKLVRLPVKSSGDKAFKADASYLITGGTGALGLAFAKSLVESGVRYICLAGRTKPAGEIAERIAEMTAAGTTVTFVQADTASLSALEDLFKTINSTMPKLAGVFHLAGVLDDAPLSSLDSRRIENALGAKAVGAFNLHKICLNMNLDHFVLFSSIAGTLGNRGQGPYGAANAFLDGLAAMRHNQGLTAQSFALGPLSGGGMGESSETVLRLFERQGFTLIPANNLFAILEPLMQTNFKYASIVHCDWNRFLDATKLAAGGMLSGLISREQQNAQKENQKSSIVKDLQDTLPANRKELLVNHLQSSAAGVIGISIEQLDTTEPLVDQGLDSLMAVDFRHEIVKNIGVEMTVATIFNIPTLEGLAAHILENCLELATDDALQAEAAPDLADSARDLLADLKKLI